MGTSADTAPRRRGSGMDQAGGPIGVVDRRFLVTRPADLPLRNSRAAQKRMRPSLRSQLAGIAGSPGTVEERADAMLEPLRRAVPCVAAWLAVRDPQTRRHRPVGRYGDTEAIARYFALPDADEELKQFDMNRRRPAVRASDVPVPLPETLAWGEYLLPAGYRNGLAVGVFTEDGRHVGFITLLSDGPDSFTAEHCDILGRLRPLIARALDRLPSLAALAQLTGDALGAVVLTHGGGCLPVPGLPRHPLLVPGSPVLTVARAHAGRSGARSTFLCPAAGGLVGIAVFDCRDEATDHLSALVLVRPVEDTWGLRPMELRILGALLEGWDDERISACCGVPWDAWHAEALAIRLGFGTVDALLLGIARAGRYVPPALWP